MSTLTTKTPTRVPTFFGLSGDGATISYATTGVTGVPSFAYKTAQTDLTLSGKEIRLVDTEFGKLVTVSVTSSDTGDTTLTLVIPRIAVTHEELTAQFETKALVMSLRQSGPVHQHYRVLNLSGIAEVRDF